MSNLERELEQELHRVLDAVASVPIPPRRAAAAAAGAVQGRRPVRTMLGGAGAALTIKILSGVAVAAAAVTVAGAAMTGSLDPTVWGQQVEEQVQACKDKLADGQHGIGDCVSAFANQHGQAVASDARHHGNGSSKDKNNNAGGNAGGNGNGNAGGSSHSKDNDKSNNRTTPPGRVSPGP